MRTGLIQLRLFAAVFSQRWNAASPDVTRTCNFLSANYITGDCTLRFPFKKADRVQPHHSLKLLYWQSEAGVFSSSKFWVRQMHRQSRQCWQLTLTGKHSWSSKFSKIFLSGLDHLTTGLSNKGKTFYSKIYCCSSCSQIKQEMTGSRQQSKDLRFRCMDWRNLPHAVTQHKQ